MTYGKTTTNFTGAGRLMPTPRVNKNGTTVIRHMRPEVTSFGNALRIPLPPPAPPVEGSVFHRERVKSLLSLMTPIHISGSRKIHLLGANTLDHHHQLDISVIRQRLDALSDPLVRAYHQYVMSSPSFRDGRSRLLLNVLTHDLDENEAGHVVFIAGAFPNKNDMNWDVREGDSQAYVTARGIHHGLLAYVDVPDDILNAPDDEKDVISALVKVTCAVAATDPKAVISSRFDEPDLMVVKDESLIDLTVEKHHEADAIVAIITERKTSDPEFIREVLQTGSSALRAGAL